MTATGTLGARLYVSNTPLTNTDGAADAIGDFQGLTYDNEVGLIETFGEHGRTFDVAKFVEVATGRTRKLKGSYDDGSMQIGLGQDLTDAGQAALKSYAAATNQNAYPFKITIVGADPSYDTIYFGAKVTQAKTQMGAANAVIKMLATLEIDTTIFVGAN